MSAHVIIYCFYSSKLASLFGMGSGGGDNESLTYTAPKQPKAKGKCISPSKFIWLASKLVIFKTVKHWV